MAVLSIEEENKKKQENAPSTSGVVNSVGAGAAVGGAGAAPDPKAPTSSGFVNLQRYLDANEGAGSTLASETTADLNSSVDSYTTEAKDKTTEGTDAYTVASRDGDASDLSKGLSKDASAAQKDAAKYLATSFGGPDVSDYTGGLADARTDLKGQLIGTLPPGSDENSQRVGGVNDVAQQRVALQDTYGKDGNYTNGFGMLDSFLMGGQQGGRDILNATEARSSEVDKAYGDAESAITSAEADARKKYGENQQLVRDSATDAYTGLTSKAEQDLAALNATGKDYYTGYKQGSAGDVLSNEQIADLQALVSLGGGETDASWWKKTFNKGEAPPEVDYTPINFYEEPVQPVNENFTPMNFFEAPEQKKREESHTAGDVISSGASNIADTVTGKKPIVVKKPKKPSWLS